MFLRILYSFLVVLTMNISYGQIGIGTTSPDTTSILDISSETKGLLIPRMLGIQKDSIMDPAEGLIVYQTDGDIGFYFYSELEWIKLSTVSKIDDLSDGKSKGDGTSLFIGDNAGSLDDNTNNQNIGIGSSALNVNINGENNVAIGVNTLSTLVEGNFNTAVGINALTSSIDGSSNTAIGFQSSLSNTSGFGNTTLGDWSMKDNALGSENTIIGFRAGEKNLGNKNVFLGNQAGINETGSQKLYINNNNADQDNALIYGEFDNKIIRTNGSFQIGNPSNNGYRFPTLDGNLDEVLSTDGNGNLSWKSTSISLNDLSDARSDVDGTNDGSSIYIGINAGVNDNNSDNRNIGIGYESMKISVGSFNTAIGYQTLLHNTSGSFNTALGYEALEVNTGDWNTALGVRTLGLNTSGHNNTAAGYYALTLNTSGTHNTAFGAQSMIYNTTGLYNSAMGNSALYNNSIGESNSALGYVSLYSNTIGDNNTASGNQSLFLNTEGNGNTAMGTESLIKNETGNNNTALGFKSYFTGIDYNNSMTLGYNSNVTGSNQIHLGNTSITEISGQVSFSTYSDARVKDNVVEDVVGLPFINRLRPVTYNFNIDNQNRLLGITDDSEYADKYALENQRFTGFIAQEVESAAQQLDFTFSGVKAPKRSNELYKISYSEFVVPLVKATQEQQILIEEQAQKIIELERIVSQFEKNQTEILNQLNQLKTK